MKFDVFSLIPEVFSGYLGSSILKNAVDNGLIEVNVHNIRDWAEGKHHVTDEPPYGGGGGMVMKPDPVFAAVEDVMGTPPDCPVILLTPQGRLFKQEDAQRFAKFPRVGLICGRYEGFDERIRRHLVTDEISIGDYVLTGGELPAMILIDAISRNLNGVLGDPDGAFDDSHAQCLLEYPHYTRPFSFRGWEVPEVLLSGNHARITQWRREQSLKRTLERRPDLLERAPLTKMDLKKLAAMGWQANPNLKEQQMRILIGTNNAHKAHEIRKILPEYEIVIPKDLGIHADIEENGSTFEENALIKARGFAKLANCPVLADDSGLEVEALNGEPGIFSARYSPKPNATDADRRQHLLENLHAGGFPRPWKARFYCAIALVTPDGRCETVAGTCEGEIIPEERGEGGFGYDPIFYVPAYDKTLSEMSEEGKNAISHRGNALKAARPLIQKFLG